MKVLTILFSNAKYLAAGMLFGFFLIKSEVISWFRIQEMLRFESFQLFGIFASAIVTGIISIQLIKRLGVKTIHGDKIVIPGKKFNKGMIFGGIVFGIGWSVTGACPGPLLAQIGSGATVVIITLLSAIAGTWTYGLFKDKLPH